MRAVPVGCVAELVERARGFEVVGIDEAQFFEHEIVGAALALADGGARVIAAGLDQDFRRLPFGPMPELLAHAEFVDKLQAVCHRCGGGGDDDAAARRRQAGPVLRRDDRRRRERAVRGALPRLPRGRRRPGDSRGVAAQAASCSLFAFRKALATAEAGFLSIATALFIAIIARTVRSALTLLTVEVKFEPFSATSFLLRTGATYWKPNMFRGSCSTTYLVEISCGSVVKIAAASTFFWSSSV